MIVQSLIPNEPDGRTIELGDVIYDFAPNAKKHNVCEVADKAHLSRLLSIDEGAAYVLYDPEAPKKPKAPLAPAKRATRGDPFAKPKEELVGDNEPAPSDAQLARARDDADDAKIPVPKGEAAKFATMTRKQLDEAFKKRFGRLPDPKTENTRIIARLTS